MIYYIGETKTFTVPTPVDTDYVDLYLTHGLSEEKLNIEPIAVSHEKVGDQEVYSPVEFSWTITGEEGFDYRIRAQDVAISSNVAYSEIFEIQQIVSHLIPGNTFKIQWENISSETIDLKYSIDRGITWEVIELGAAYTPSDNLGEGSYDWLVPITIPLGLIRISGYDTVETDRGFDQAIYVVESEKYIGSTWKLEWEEFISDTVRIEYRLLNSSIWNLIEESAPNHNGVDFGEGYYDLLIDETYAADSFVVRVTDVENNIYLDKPPVAVVAFSGPELPVIINVQSRVQQPSARSILKVVNRISLTSRTQQPSARTVVKVVNRVSSISRIQQPLVRVIIGTTNSAISTSRVQQPSARTVVKVVNRVSSISRIQQPLVRVIIGTTTNGIISTSRVQQPSARAIINVINRIISTSRVQQPVGRAVVVAYNGGTIPSESIQVILNRLNSLESSINSITLIVAAMQSGYLTEQRFKELVFNRVNTVVGSNITEYIAGGDTVVRVQVNSSRIPVSETIVED